MTHAGMAGNGAGWASGQGRQAGKVGRRETGHGRKGRQTRRETGQGRQGRARQSGMAGKVRRCPRAACSARCVGLSSLSSCLSAPLGACLPRQTRTRATPRGGRVPLRTLHITERELL